MRKKIGLISDPSLAVDFFKAKQKGAGFIDMGRTKREYGHLTDALGAYGHALHGTTNLPLPI